MKCKNCRREIKLTSERRLIGCSPYVAERYLVGTIHFAFMCVTEDQDFPGGHVPCEATDVSEILDKYEV